MVILIAPICAALAQQNDLPTFSPRKMNVLISNQVRGLVGKDRVGDFVRYEAVGQNFLGSNVIIPCNETILKSYLDFARRDPQKGFDNPYASILTFIAISKFGRLSEYSAVYLPDTSGHFDVKASDALAKDQMTFEQGVKAVQPLFELQIDGISKILYAVIKDGKDPILQEVALVKKGRRYFAVRVVPYSPLGADIINALYFGTMSHYWPVYSSHEP